MKTVRFLAAALTVAILLAGGVLAQDFPKPGPEHAQLKKLAGEWVAEVKCHMPGSNTPQESKGEYTAKLDVGGYFLVTEFKCQLGGQPFHGRGLNGYDPVKKKYVGVWVDSMSPSIYTTEGAFEESGKVFSETMTGLDPLGKPMKMRMTTELKDNDHLLFLMFSRGEDGKDILLMEIAYTRR
jgi:hypothetical protein